ncbi:pimeloyl-[acyl-carrier protein] methyl ester esterase [Aliidiomarina taiwanensis]|uniref:Pimeloyl-[acyl-carrier protein] methyl ester esterase n=1 Tax=Aliidiomarina taiwanensis TaxID=946228 RepID=A0A432X767_9GAMM|nr:pimeloyl-ACP methyl ester esterase BioH [Aliidiomarina taiwanensis]RUO42709.1 pimeloyl-[acyl-carrier protein] methyl ester esterase [Aliidiomarina taiwanensis]
MTISDSVHGTGASWVFLHGWGMHQGVWQPILNELTDSLRMRTVDLPGYGQSPWHASYEDFEQAVTALEQHLLQHETGPVNLLGWSMGGLFATALAARGNLNVQRLALVASTPKFAQADHWPGIQPTVLAAFEKQLKRDYKATIERFIAVQAMGSPHMKDDIRALSQLLTHAPSPAPEALLAGLNWLQHIDLREAFTQLSCPSLRIYGRRDSLVPVAQAEQIHKPIDHMEVFNDSAHTPFLNEPAHFCQTLLAFVRSNI